MANLQQCLFHYSVQPPQPRRRRRKRNKGRKAMTPLNNSIIQELRRQRSTTGSIVNSNLIRLDIPGRSIVIPSIKESEPKATIQKTTLKPIVEKSVPQTIVEKSPLKPTVVNSAVKPTIKKSPLEPIVEKSALTPKVVNSAVKLTIEKSPLKPTLVNSAVKPTIEKSPLKPIVEKSALTPKVVNSAVKPTIEKSPLKPIVGKPALKPTVVNSAVKPTIEKSPLKPIVGKPALKPTVVNSAVKPTIEKSPLKPTLVNSAVKPTIEKSPLKPTLVNSVVKPTIEKSPLKPTLVNSALKPTVVNSAVKPTIEKSPLKPTLVNSAVKPTIEKSPLKPTLVNSVVKPTIEKSPLKSIVGKPALKQTVVNSAVKPTIEKSPLKPIVGKPALKPKVVNSAVKSTIEKSPPKPTVETSAAKPTIGELTINLEFQKLTASQSFKTSLANQTIDLSSDESSNETCNWTCSGKNKSCVRSRQEADLIDLSEDVPDENEIILLNDDSKFSEGNCRKITPSENKSYEACSPNVKPASNTPLNCERPHSRSKNKSLLSKSPERKRLCIRPSEYEQPKTKPASSTPPVNGSETVVIDISDDGNENDVGLSVKDDTNDEILVIGTFNKTSKPKAVSLKKLPKKIRRKLIRNRLKKLLDGRTEQPRRNRKVSSTIVRRQEAFDFGETSSGTYNANVVELRSRVKAKYFSRVLQSRKSMDINLLDTIKYQRLLLNNKLSGTALSNGIGGNVYINAPVYIPSSGPRPIMIDGSNVAFTSDNPFKFSCKRLSICIKYFKEKGHKVTAFVPQFRAQSNQSDDPELLDELVRSGDVVLTPSKVIDGKLIVPYDDRFIVQAAVLKGGVIISRDNFKDLLEENPAWAETIKYRTLAFTWVDDVLMFPSDPLGVVGPSLDEFLSFN